MNVLYSSTQMHYMFGAFTFVTFQKEFNSFMHFHFTSPEQSHLWYVCMSQTIQSDKCSLVPLKKALNMHNTCHFEGKLMSFTVGITFKRAQMRMHTVLLCRLLTVSDYTCYLWSPSQQHKKKSSSVLISHVNA